MKYSFQNFLVLMNFDCETELKVLIYLLIISSNNQNYFPRSQF